MQKELCGGIVDADEPSRGLKLQAVISPLTVLTSGTVVAVLVFGVEQVLQRFLWFTRGARAHHFCLRAEVLNSS